MVINEFLLLIRISLYEHGNSKMNIDNFDWKAIWQMSELHATQTLIIDALECIDSSFHDDLVSKKVKELFMHLVVIDYNQIFECERIENIFEKNHIKILPIKGICTKTRYKKSYLRTMGDIDFLYFLDGKDKEIKSIMKEVGFSIRKEGRKHDIYNNEELLLVEMHRTIFTNQLSYSSYFDIIWDRCKKKEQYEYVYELSVEDEYILNIAHFAEHMKLGGVGIRFVLDIFIYEHLHLFNNESINLEYVRSELSRIGLLQFYQQITAIADRWFLEDRNCAEKIEINEKLEAYIVSGGVFGTMQREADLAVSGGKINAIRQSVFPNKKSMETMFSWLSNYPFLLPVSWILRIIRALKDRPENVKHYIGLWKSGNRVRGEELTNFLKECGLS